jgi:hypothetical protein
MNHGNLMNLLNDQNHGELTTGVAECDLGVEPQTIREFTQQIEQARSLLRRLLTEATELCKSGIACDIAEKLVITSPKVLGALLPELLLAISRLPPDCDNETGSQLTHAVCLALPVGSSHVMHQLANEIEAAVVSIQKAHHEEALETLFQTLCMMISNFIISVQKKPSNPDSVRAMLISILGEETAQLPGVNMFVQSIPSQMECETDLRNYAGFRSTEDK